MKYIKILLVIFCIVLMHFIEGIQENSKALKISYEIVNHDATPDVYPCKFIAENLPKYEPFKFQGFSLDNQLIFNAYCMVDDQNQIINLQTYEPLENVKLIGFAPGEPILFIASSVLHKWESTVGVTPNPIKVHDNNGHHLTLIRMTSDAFNFQYSVSGFDPGELIYIHSISGREELEFPYVVPLEGTINGNISPAILGKDFGTAMLEFKGKTTDLKVNYEWGIKNSTSYKTKSIDNIHKAFK